MKKVVVRVFHKIFVLFRFNEALSSLKGNDRENSSLSDPLPQDLIKTMGVYTHNDEVKRNPQDISI